MQDSFRTLLDEALIITIASDYDLKSPSGYQGAEETLKGLSQDVVLEEATGFNPSGTSGAIEEPNGVLSDDASTSATSLSRHHSRGQNTESSSTDLSSTPADTTYSVPRLTSFNDDSEETKFLNLRSVFTELKEYDIKHSLKKANGDFQVALDDLLNIQYLQSTGQHARGIDAFFQPDDSPPKGKKKKKKNNKNPGTPQTTLDLDSTSRDVLERNQAKELKRQSFCLNISYIFL